jgi:hypothetical protein
MSVAVRQEVCMGRRRLVLGELNLRPGEKVNKPDKAEELANRVLELFDLEVDEDQFEVMCDVVENTALNKNGVLKDHRSLAGICAEVSQAKVPDDVRTALLLVLLKDRFKEMRAKAHEVSRRPENTEEHPRQANR